MSFYSAASSGGTPSSLPIPSMSHTHVASSEDAVPLREDLASAERLALDCEAAGFHRYSDRLCLLQLTTAHATYVIDPMGFDPAEVLREPLEHPDVEVVMHGADFDLRLLARDLGIELRGLFDTQIAAQIVGEDAIGLAALLQSRLAITVSKKYQRADWAERPLTDAMLEYAADDTRYLMTLADALRLELDGKGRSAWAEEECEVLERTVGVTGVVPTDSEDPVVRVKGARKLPVRAVAALRVALEWRDEIARDRDRAPFRVVSDGPLIDAAASLPRRVADLSAIKGFPNRLAKDEGPELIDRLQTVAQAPESELRPYPARPRATLGRPSPEVEELADRLKLVRNRRAEEIGLPRGTLLPNAVVLEVARTAPTTPAQLMAVEGMRQWKADVVGEELLRVVRGRG